MFCTRGEIIIYNHVQMATKYNCPMTKQVHILLFILIILDLRSDSVCIVSLYNCSSPYRFAGVPYNNNVRISDTQISK